MTTMFYIVNIETNRKLRVPSKYANMTKDTWKSKGAAQRVINEKNLNNTHKIVATCDYVPNMVERTNLMSGEKYMEAEDTPPYLSPACEAYWSM